MQAHVDHAAHPGMSSGHGPPSITSTSMPELPYSVLPDTSTRPYQKLFIYHTKHGFLIAGYCRARNLYGLLHIKRDDGPELQATQYPYHYTLHELNSMLRQTYAANEHQGGLQFVTKAYGIIGCIRFTSSFYLLIVTRKAHVATICGHKVYRVGGVALLPLGAAMGVSQQKDSTVERRYRKLLMGVELTRNFYFSYTYHLGAHLQRNHDTGMGPGLAATGVTSSSTSSGTSSSTAPSAPPPVGFSASSFSAADFDSMFVWNSYLTGVLRTALGGTQWVVALVHGFVEQRTLSVLGRPLTLTLIARRSRFFAGTRFKKRGLNSLGRVANEVETEQILDAGTDYRSGLPLLSSLVQLRGSVPLFWSQQPTPLSPKPDVVLGTVDATYEATQAHFDDLRERYGDTVVVLNLLKGRERRPRETLLRREFAAAVTALNRKVPLHKRVMYVQWDFQKHAKLAGAGLLREIEAVTQLALDATGLFVFNPQAAHTAALAAAATAATAATAAAPATPATAAAARDSRAQLVARTQSRSCTSGAWGAAAGRPPLPVSCTQSLQPAPIKPPNQRQGGQSHSSQRPPKGSSATAQQQASLGSGAGAGALQRDSRQYSSQTNSQTSGGGATAAPATAPQAGEAAGAPGVTAVTAVTAGPAVTKRQARYGLVRGFLGRAASGTGSTVSYCQRQRGVLRTNCIDCLDRTNVAQFAVGLSGLGRQLLALGITDTPDMDHDSSMARLLMELYEGMGNTLAMQYGGSDAHAAFFQRKKGEWEASTRSKDLVTSIRRFYSNTYTDAEKQDAINLFLGNFVPSPGHPELWELETDVYLHSADPRSAMEGACPSTAAAAVPPPAMRRIQSIIPRVYGESLRDGSLPHSPSSPFIRLQSSATQAHPSSSSSSTTPKVLRTHEQTQQQPGKDVTEADGALGGVDGTPAGSVVVDPKGGSSTGGAKASRWRAGHSCLPSLVVLSSDDEAEVGGQDQSSTPRPKPYYPITQDFGASYSSSASVPVTPSSARASSEQWDLGPAAWPVGAPLNLGMSPNSSTPLAQTPAAAASMGSTSGVQARDASTSHSSWGLTSLFRTLFTAGTRPSSSPSLPVLYGGIPTTLTFFDALLSMQCRRPVAVRVYSTESDKTGNSLGWAVVQQAFAALWDYSGNGLLHSASSADLTRVASSFGNGPATASAASIAAATAGATAMSTATHTAAGSGPWTAQPPQPPHASIAGHHEAGQGHMRNSWGDQGDQEEREGASLWWGTHRVSCMAVGGCSMAVTAGSTATAVTQYMWARMDPLTAPINRGGSQQLQRGGGRWVGGSTEGGASGLAGPAVRPSVMSLDKGKHKNMQGAGSSRDTSCHGAGAAGRLLGGTAAGPGSTAGTSTGAAAAIQAPVHHRAGMAQTHHSSYTSFASFPHVPSSIALPTFTQPLPNHRQTATNHPTAVAGSASTPGTAAAGTASSSYSSYLSPTKLWSAFANVAGPSKPGTDPPFHRPGESGAATAATAAAGAGAAAVAAVAGPAAPGAAGGASAVPWGQQPVGGPHHSSNWSNHNRDMRASYGNDHVTAGQAAVIGGSGWARGHDTGQAYASRTAPGKGEGEWVGTSGQVRGEHHGRNDSWGMEGGVVERKQVQVQVYDDHFSFLAALAGSGQQGGRQQLRSSWDGGAGAATPSLHGGSRGSRGHRSELKMRGQVSGASLGYGAAQQHSVATRPADARSPSTTHAQGDSWQVRGMSQPEQALVGVMMRDLGRPVTAASQHREAVTGLRRAPSMGCDAPASCSVAGLFLDDLADCGLAWEVQGWWAAAQEDLDAAPLAPGSAPSSWAAPPSSTTTTAEHAATMPAGAHQHHAAAPHRAAAAGTPLLPSTTTTAHPSGTPGSHHPSHQVQSKHTAAYLHWDTAEQQLRGDAAAYWEALGRPLTGAQHAALAALYWKDLTHRDHNIVIRARDV